MVHEVIKKHIEKFYKSHCPWSSWKWPRRRKDFYSKVIELTRLTLIGIFITVFFDEFRFYRNDLLSQCNCSYYNIIYCINPHAIEERKKLKNKGIIIWAATSANGVLTFLRTLWMEQGPIVYRINTWFYTLQFQRRSCASFSKLVLLYIMLILWNICWTINLLVEELGGEVNLWTGHQDHQA